MERVRLPPIPDNLTSNTPDPTTKIIQTPDGTTIVHAVRQGVEGHIQFMADGSFKYHSNTGSMVEFFSNNEMRYSKGGFTLTIDNNQDVKMNGHGRINVDHDAHIEVAKNASIAVNGMADIHSTGHVKFTAADIYLGSTKGSVVINAARDIEMTSTKGRFTLNTTGVQTFTTSSGDFHVNTQGQIDLNSQMDTTINAQGKFTSNSQSDTVISSAAKFNTNSQADTNINSQGNLTANSGSKTTLNAGGDVVTKGATTKIQGGGSSLPPTTFS